LNLALLKVFETSSSLWALSPFCAEEPKPEDLHHSSASILKRVHKFPDRFPSADRGKNPVQKHRVVLLAQESFPPGFHLFLGDLKKARDIFRVRRKRRRFPKRVEIFRVLTPTA